MVQAEVAVGTLEGRRALLRRRMKERGIDAAIVAPGANLYYLASYWGHISRRFTALVAGAGGEEREVFVCPDFEESLHRSSAAGVETFSTWKRRAAPEGPAAEAIRSWGAATGTIAIDPGLPWHQAQPLLEALPQAKFVNAAPLLADLRMVKSEEEIGLLRQAAVAAHHAISAATANLKVGVHEREVSEGFVRRCVEIEAGAEPWILSLFGPASAEPHGLPDSRALTDATVVLLDYGTSHQKYRSDTTRTYFYGEVEDEAKRLWEIVHRAYTAAFEATRPGKTLTELDGAARKVITDAGYGEYFNHGLGHGIGLEVHERPYPEPNADVELKEGMTFTIEPGIYLPGRFGVRLENVVIVRDGGAEAIYDEPAMRMGWI